MISEMCCIERCAQLRCRYGLDKVVRAERRGMVERLGEWMAGVYGLCEVSMCCRTLVHFHHTNYSFIHRLVLSVDYLSPAAAFQRSTLSLSLSAHQLTHHIHTHFARLCCTLVSVSIQLDPITFVLLALSYQLYRHVFLSMSYNPAYAYPPQPVAMAAPYQGQHYSIQQQGQPQYYQQPPQQQQQQPPAYMPTQPQYYHNGPVRPQSYQPTQAQSVGLAPQVTAPLDAGNGIARAAVCTGTA